MLSTPARRRACLYVCARWTDAGLPVRLAVCPSERFCKAMAVLPALRSSRASTVLVADADVLCDRAVETAAAIRDGEKIHGRPHTNVYRLGQKATAGVYEYGTFDLHDLDRPVYQGIAGGGIVIGKREALLDVPLDARFEGWGGEDDSWGNALHTLLGPPLIGGGDLIHLWHEPQSTRPSKSIAKGGARNEALRKRYNACVGRPLRMQALIDEAKDFYGKQTQSCFE